MYDPHNYRLWVIDNTNNFFPQFCNLIQISETHNNQSLILSPPIPIFPQIFFHFTPLPTQKFPLPKFLTFHPPPPPKKSLTMIEVSKYETYEPTTFPWNVLLSLSSFVSIFVSFVSPYWLANDLSRDEHQFLNLGTKKCP